MARMLYLLAAGALALPSAAFAIQPVSNSGEPTITTFSLNGTAPKTCVLGSAANSTLNIGEMTDPANGELATISNPPSTSIANSWCNTASTITVLATPLVAQSFIGSPPSGFTKAVNYTATVSSWTTNPATFATNGNESGVQHNNTAGSQSQSAPEQGTINVGISGFASPNTGDFLVADNNYSGTITITLTPNP